MHDWIIANNPFLINQSFGSIVLNVLCDAILWHTIRDNVNRNGASLLDSSCFFLYFFSLFLGDFLLPKMWCVTLLWNILKNNTTGNYHKKNRPFLFCILLSSKVHIQKWNFYWFVRLEIYFNFVMLGMVLTRHRHIISISVETDPVKYYHFTS